METNLLPADTYIVVNKTLLNNNDRLILSLLYQPIIGSIATSLYFTLWSYLDKREIVSTEWTHHHLMANMRIDLMTIYQAREKLEGIGLIKTYFKKDKVNNYIYELYSPISPFDFFSNPILNTSLYNNIGKLEYEKTVAYFEIPKIKINDYVNITKSFSSVFDSIDQNSLEILSNDIKIHSYRQLDIISSIDLDEILSNVPEEILNHRSVNNDIKDLIYKLSFIYQLNNDISIELIKNSVNDKKMIDKEILKTNCHNYFKFEHNGKLPTIAYKQQPEYLRKKDVNLTKRAKMIYTFETTSPHDFLLGKSDYNNLTKNDKEILAYLLIDLNLNPGIVNVLIDYVLRINNNKLIKSFVEVIAMQWKRCKVETVEDAMKLAEEEYKKASLKKNSKIKEKIIEDVPDWLNKEINSEELDENSKKEIEELLKEYR